jgi:hypothetical protein
VTAPLAKVGRWTQIYLHFNSERKIQNGRHNQTLMDSQEQATSRENRDQESCPLIEVWIDETERRTWFLVEAGQREMTSGH